MVRVNVICGGSSGERKVSLRSGAAVVKALEEAGYEVTTLDSAIAGLNEIAACDVVFPVLHGAGGEDGTLQAELEKRGVKFVGSGAAASALCFDKWQYRQKVSASLPMAPAALVQADNYQAHKLTRQPFVLKPLNGGSSIDTFIVRDTDNIPQAALTASFQRYPTMLLEQLIEGTELTVGVLGDQALPIIEIIPPKDGEFDYENKYNGQSQELCPPEHVSEQVQKTAQDLALQAHQLTGCRDFSRTDIMCGHGDNLFLLETNTIPGMTDQSLFPKMAAAAGLPMPELCKQLVEMALQH